MSDIALAIVEKLTTDPDVEQAIGGRIYPEYVKEADRVYPLVVMELQIGIAEGFDGPSGLEYAVAQIAAVAKSYSQAVAVAGLIKTALDGKSGTWADVEVQGAFLQPDGLKDDVVTDPKTEEILYYVRVLSFDLAYTA